MRQICSNPMSNFRALGVIAAGLIASATASSAPAAVVSSMVTPGGASATITITLTVTTGLGTSSDADTKTMTVLGTANEGFIRSAPPFTATQFNAMQLNFSNTTFVFDIFCLPFIGCQHLNATITNLRFELAQPACSAINAPPSGAVSFVNAQIHTTGSYSTTGIATASGVLDSTGPSTFNGRVTNPTGTTVKLDQLTLADQLIVVPPASLPAGVTALSFLVHTDLTNTTLSGPFVAAGSNLDGDNDGILDGCDTCTDSDGDGYGNPGYPGNTCALDNCPNVSNPDQLDTNGNGIGDACDHPPCIADIAPPPPNGNTAVNVDDLLVVINSWGACPAPCRPHCLADIAPPGGDCFVNVDDLLKVINSWGACP